MRSDETEKRRLLTSKVNEALRAFDLGLRNPDNSQHYFLDAMNALYRSTETPMTPTKNFVPYFLAWAEQQCQKQKFGDELWEEIRPDIKSRVEAWAETKQMELDTQQGVRAGIQEVLAQQFVALKPAIEAGKITVDDALFFLVGGFEKLAEEGIRRPDIRKLLISRGHLPAPKKDTR